LLCVVLVAVCASLHHASEEETVDVRLFMVVGVDRHLPLLPHFLDHWTRVLGVEPRNVYPDVRR